jgi:hypothetical protein
VLVACIFQGLPAKKDAPFVCHNDKPPAKLTTKLKWEAGLEVPPPDVRPGSLQFPCLASCSDRNCVNPLCLHYSTQAENCITAHTTRVVVAKKLRVKCAL